MYRSELFKNDYHTNTTDTDEPENFNESILTPDIPPAPSTSAHPDKSVFDKLSKGYAGAIAPETWEWLKHDSSEFAHNLVNTFNETFDFYPNLARRDALPKIAQIARDLPYMIPEEYRERIQAATANIERNGIDNHLAAYAQKNTAAANRKANPQPLPTAAGVAAAPAAKSTAGAGAIPLSNNTTESATATTGTQTPTPSKRTLINTNSELIDMPVIEIQHIPGTFKIQYKKQLRKINNILGTENSLPEVHPETSNPYTDDAFYYNQLVTLKNDAIKRNANNALIREQNKPYLAEREVCDEYFASQSFSKHPEFNHANSLNRAHTMLLNSVATIADATAESEDIIFSRIDTNKIEDDIHQQFTQNPTAYYQLSEQDLANIVHENIYNALPLNSISYGRQYIFKPFTEHIETKSAKAADIKIAAQDAASAKYTGASLMKAYTDIINNPQYQHLSAEQILERFQAEALEILIKYSYENPEKIKDLLNSNLGAFSSGLGTFEAVDPLLTRHPEISKTLAPKDGSIDANTLTLTCALYQTYEDITNHRQKLAPFIDRIETINAAAAEYEAILQMSDAEIIRNYPETYQLLKDDFGTNADANFDKHAAEVIRAAARKNQRNYRFQADVYLDFSDIMLGYDKFHNFDAIPFNVYSNIAGAFSDQARRDRDILNAAAELANKYGASPFGEWGGNAIKDYTAALAILVISAFTEGTPLVSYSLAAYGGLSTVTDFKTKWTKLKEDDSLTDADRFNRLFWYGVENGCINLISKRGGAHVKNTVSRYIPNKVNQEMIEGTTGIITKHGLKENNKREDQYYF